MPSPSVPLADWLAQSAYQGYSYAYPHKTAYRPFDPPMPLAEAWRDEPRSGLFLYLHVPFCGQRCGYCNLFSEASPSKEAIHAWLTAVELQAKATKVTLPDARFARLAMGGGTPTFLDEATLERLLGLLEQGLGARPACIPASVEASPETLTPAKARLLRAWGFDRLSLGIQSFCQNETAAIGRAAKPGQAEAAATFTRSEGFPILNLDLIYGLPGQTISSWLSSINRALGFRPEEIFLYPLYVRLLTGLARRPPASPDFRLEMYREGRDLLLAAGYRQVSMRAFRAAHAPPPRGPAYRAEEDGMVGLGCGARSYTRGLHYAQPFAVGATEVRTLIREYAGQTDGEFAVVHHGIALDLDEQGRRYVIKTLLEQARLPLLGYRQRFGIGALDHLPQLLELEPAGLATRTEDFLHLTPAGLERSDVLGPWLYSARVRALMASHSLR
jgi:oxygen-independent coproporphyrinogen-3 oxidase